MPPVVVLPPVVVPPPVVPPPVVVPPVVVPPVVPVVSVSVSFGNDVGMSSLLSPVVLVVSGGVGVSGFGVGVDSGVGVGLGVGVIFSGSGLGVIAGFVGVFGIVVGTNVGEAKIGPAQIPPPPLPCTLQFTWNEPSGDVYILPAPSVTVRE